MQRSLIALLLCLTPALADARKDYVAARKSLEEANFETLLPGERDDYFARMAAWDHQETVKAISVMIGRYGVYLDTLEARMRQNREKVAPFMNRPRLSDQQIALRNTYLRKLKKDEDNWRLGNVSLEKLVAAMGQWKEPKTLSMAINFMPKQQTWRVRQVSALACAEWHRNVQSENLSKKLFKVLKKLAKDSEPRVRQATARALASYQRLEALPVLKQCLNDPDWRVRSAAIETVRKNPSDETVDMLVLRMQKEKGRLEDDINKALQEISGRKINYAEEWLGWWKGAGRRVPPKGASTDVNAPVDPDKKPKPGHKFYGIRTRSLGVVYVIDMSGSMKREVEQIKRAAPVTGKKGADTPEGGKTRWEVARNELKRAIRNLNRRAKFTFILFNHSVQPWQSEMIDASPANKKKALEFLDKIEPRGATFTLGALRQAFALGGVEAVKGKSAKEGPPVDTIFVLSDGGPTDSKMSGAQPMEPDPILAQVKEWNKDLGAVIHTIAVHTDEVGTYFLKQLAAQNGGQYVERK
ncbi:MAG: HEAT repeat domain-containing protein [Planctomycetota bacterium]